MSRRRNYALHNSAPTLIDTSCSVASECSFHITPSPVSHNVENDTVRDGTEACPRLPNEGEAADSLSSTQQRGGYDRQILFREYNGQSLYGEATGDSLDSLLGARAPHWPRFEGHIPTGRIQESRLLATLSPAHWRGLVSGGSSDLAHGLVRMTAPPRSAARQCPHLASFSSVRTRETEDEQTETNDSSIFTQHVPPPVLMHETRVLPLFPPSPADAFQPLANERGFPAVAPHSTFSTSSHKTDMHEMERTLVVHSEPPCMPQTIRRLGAAVNIFSGDDHLSRIPISPILGGFILDKNDHAWMMNDILNSVLTLSDPHLLNVYRHVARHPCNAICFERYIGVASELVLAVAKISELADWKRRHEDLGQLDRMELCSRANDIRESLSSYRFFEHIHVVTHQPGPTHTFVMERGPSIILLPDFIFKLSELYKLTIDAYLESVVSGVPGAPSVSLCIQILVAKLLRHLNMSKGAMGQQELRLLKFPFFMVITMMTPGLEPQVGKCFKLMKVHPCKRAVKEISNLALDLAHMRQSRLNARSPDVTWRDAVLASLGSEDGGILPVCDMLWI